MNLRSSAAALLTFGLGIGCAGAPGGDASSASEQQRIAANSPSDVGICYPSPPAALITPKASRSSAVRNSVGFALSFRHCTVCFIADCIVRSV